LLDFNLGSRSKDTFARVWDLRTGRSIAPLEGHTDSVLSVSWSPNGFVVATGGADNTIRIHDVRHLKTNLAKIPAHASNVSSIKFHRPMGDTLILSSGPNKEELPEVECGRIYRGDFMVSSGYDGTVKYWGSGDWKCIKTLNVGNEGEKIMEVDVTDGNDLFSCIFWIARLILFLYRC
jgi:U4/U6 small nuclear ribonucleoprotein PRP4